MLYQSVGIPDVCQAEPEHGPHSIHKAAITVLKVPAQRQTGARYLTESTESG